MTKKLSGLYAITNQTLMPENIFLTTAQTAIESGISILQYRDKSHDTNKKLQQATALKKMCDSNDVLFIINDDIELAKKINADGVHIGQNDASLMETKKSLGNNKIIGVSCYNQLELANRAVKYGADYIAFGRFFNSSTKPDTPQANIKLISKFKQQHDIPVCCIGGITTENCQPLIDSGADMLAVINNIFHSTDIKNIEKKCNQFNKLMSSFI